MSHVTCYKCGGNEHTAGFGFAAGPLGSYTICECGALLEFVPDLDGLDEQTVAKIQTEVADWLATLRGTT